MLTFSFHDNLYGTSSAKVEHRFDIMNAINSDSSLDNSTVFMNSYSKYSSGDSFNNTTTEEKNDPFSKAMKEIMCYKAKNKTTLEATSNLASLLNNKESHVFLPTKPSILKKQTNMQFSREFILICTCGKLCDGKNWCTKCKSENTKTKSNFVVRIALAQ